MHQGYDMNCFSAVCFVASKILFPGGFRHVSLKGLSCKYLEIPPGRQHKPFLMYEIREVQFNLGKFSLLSKIHCAVL